MSASQGSDASSLDLQAFRLLNEIFQEADSSDQLDKEALRALVQGFRCSDVEKEAMLRLLDRVHEDDAGHVTLKEWTAFVYLFEEEIMRKGHVNNLVHTILYYVDLFRVGAWHDFEYYRQVSFLGAAISVVSGLVFLSTVVMSIMSFSRDEKTIIQQTFLPNSFNAANVGSFFLFFRTANWENTLDSSLLTFQMSYYTKRLDDTTGAIIEEYTTVPSRNVTKKDISWWPDSIGANTIAVAPVETITLEGAYHLDHFKQLEVKLLPCQNSSSVGAVICKSPKEIQDALHGGSVNFVVMSSANGYVTAETTYWTTLVGETKQIDLWFDRKTLQVTAKYPHKTDQITELMPFARATQQIAPVWYDGSLAVWWFTQTDTAMHEMHVRETATQLIAEWGGTWASIISFFGLAAHAYNKYRLDSQINELRERSRIVEDLRITSKLGRNRVAVNV